MSLIIDYADRKDIFCKIRRRGVSSYFPRRFVVQALFLEWHAPQAPIPNINPRKHMILSFSTIFLRAHCFTRILIQRKKAIHFSTFSRESSPKPQNPNQLRFLPLLCRQSLQRIQHPFSLTINNFSWSTFKKKSLSWNWKFSVWATGNAPKNTRLKVSPTKATSQPRKRSKDWPHDFVPSIQGECDKLNLSEFVSGFLIMIKTYDAKLKEAFLAHLALLMIKAISYSWSSVRAFHKFVAKQAEQWRLERHDTKAINEQAATFFRHSDLRSSSPYHTLPVSHLRYYAFLDIQWWLEFLPRYRRISLIKPSLGFWESQFFHRRLPSRRRCHLSNGVHQFCLPRLHFCLLFI